MFRLLLLLIFCFPGFSYAQTAPSHGDSCVGSSSYVFKDVPATEGDIHTLICKSGNWLLVNELDASGQTIKYGNLILNAHVNDAGDIIFREGNDNQKGRIWTSHISGQEILYLSSGDNVADLTINEVGHIGINNTNPSAPLSFANTNDNVTANKIRLWNSEHATYGVGVSAYTFDFFTHKNYSFFQDSLSATRGTEVFTIADGNVGINEASPENKLHIVGDAFLEGELHFRKVPESLVSISNNGGAIVIKSDGFYQFVESDTGTVLFEILQGTSNDKVSFRPRVNQSEPAVCNASHAGSMAQTKTYKLCVCDGTSWKILNTSTACSW